MDTKESSKIRNKLLSTLAFLCIFATTVCLPLSAKAATIKRTNVAGTLFLVSLIEEEKFSSGDVVFIVIEGQLKTTGTVKIESDGNVYLRPKMPITNLKQGDELLITHDPIWLNSGQARSTIVSGTVGSVSGENIFIKLDERFQPVFSLNSPIEIQIEETLLAMPASAIEYRKTGIWFKVTGEIDKLPAGTVVSFPHTQTAGRSIAAISRRLKQGTTTIFYRFGRSALSLGEVNRNDSGYSAGIVATHDIHASKSFIFAAGAGAEYQSLTSSGTTAGVKIDYEITQFSAVFHGSPQFRINDKIRGGLFGEYHYGLNGSSNSKTKSESNALNAQISSFAIGLTGSYMISPNSLLGLNLGFSSTKVTIANEDASDSYNGNGNSQVIYFAKLF